MTVLVPTEYDLADYVRKLRKGMDETQDEFAEHANVGNSTLRNIETRVVRKPDLDTLKKIASYTKEPLAKFIALMDAAEADGDGDSPPVSPFPTPPVQLTRRRDDVMSAQAWDVAQQYDNLPPLAQTAIDAIIRAFKQKSAEKQ